MLFCSKQKVPLRLNSISPAKFQTIHRFLDLFDQTIHVVTLSVFQLPAQTLKSRTHDEIYLCDYSQERNVKTEILLVYEHCMHRFSIRCALTGLRRSRTLDWVYLCRPARPSLNPSGYCRELPGYCSHYFYLLFFQEISYPSNSLFRRFSMFVFLALSILPLPQTVYQALNYQPDATELADPFCVCKLWEVDS